MIFILQNTLGTIPSSIGSLTKVTVLGVGQNKLNGMKYSPAYKMLYYIHC